ncbi:MAG: LysM peptidoglycan-binding domain-containing protein [Chloroflexi bacterium]|nr:LysM peptidoglycan-binding domain-containing protein [Chloroflexota bacterium]
MKRISYSIVRQVRTLFLIALALVLVLGLLGGCSKSKGKSAEDAAAAKKPAGSVPTATLSPVQPTPVLLNQPLGSPVSPIASPSPTSTFQASPSATKPAGSNVEPGDLAHIVQSGETLYGIASMYKVTVDDLAKLNEIPDRSYVRVGQKLLIPKGGVKPTPTTAAPTSVASPTATSAPATATPTPTAAAPTPTATPTLPPTPTSSPTPTPSPYLFRQDSITTEPNCGLTAIGGTLLDAQGNGVAGYRVVAGDDIWKEWSHTTDPTGGDGKYGVILDIKPKAGRWYVYIIDSGGNQVSPRLLIETTDTDCAPTGAGRQNMKVNFRKS